MADPLITDDATLAGDPAVTEHPVAGAGPGWPARLGHYVMLQELGRGGMGIVCAAYDQVLDRKVAIKLWELGEHDLAREQAAIALGMLAADDPQLEQITAWSSEHQ